MDHYRLDEKELKFIEKSSIPFGVYQFVDKRVVSVALSDGFRELLGIDSMEKLYTLMDNDMYRDVHPDDVAEVADAAIRFATDNSEYDVVYRSRVNNEYTIIHAIGRYVYTDDGTRLAEVHYMNEGRYNSEDGDVARGFNLLQNRSFQNNDAVAKISYDYLTGMPDMNYFFELAEACKEKAYSEGRHVSMLFFDLSGMKAFNQKYGYTEGDKLIKAFAKSLVDIFSNENCCRITADHFAVYAYSDYLEGIMDDLSDRFKDINEGNSLPVRIGVYDTVFGDASATTACDRAKIACDGCGDIFETKINFFDKRMLKYFEDKRYVFENLDKAISEGWIKVYYQPIVRTANGRVCDEEALARWIDPIKGILSPADFIPILEDAKIAYKLDLYVAEQVIAKLKDQAERGYYVVPNSINLSRTDFYACDMVEEIRRRVDEAGVERSRITIEITESVIMDDIDFMLSQVDRFRKLGFKVWMDDFGSGYSSPDILQRIHFDVVKIDKLFVDQIEKSEGSRIIITELVRMAGALGSDTVAEGVETEAQVEFLKEIGCTRLQGYYYCRPIPLEGIYERYNKGVQIGFENPEESDYYAMLGNVNLYDVSFNTEDDDSKLNNYFNTMPMFIVEVGDDIIRLARGNKSYRDFMLKHYPTLYGRTAVAFSQANAVLGTGFTDAVLECKKDGKNVVEDVRTTKSEIVHLFFRKIVTNPVTGIVAIAIVILGYEADDSATRQKEELERITRERQVLTRITALSGKYISVYMVDPVTDHFIQYMISDVFSGMGEAVEGDDFYKQAAISGKKVVHEDDLQRFLSYMKKDNFLEEIQGKGIFSFEYRVFFRGVDQKVCLKAAMTESEDGPQIVVGITEAD